MFRKVIFLFLLVVFPFSAFADTLYSVPLFSEYNTASYAMSDTSQYKTVELDCSAVGGDVTSIGMWVWGYSSAPYMTDVYLIFSGATSSNATTSTGVYPATFFEWTFSPSVPCVSGTSTISFSGTGDKTRSGFSWSSPATTTQYVSYDPSWSVPMIISGVSPDVPSDPVATTSTSTLSSLSTDDFVFMLAILLVFISFAFTAWIYEHNYFPRI